MNIAVAKSRSEHAESETTPAQDSELVLRAALSHAIDYLNNQHENTSLPVGPTGDDDDVRLILGGDLPENSTDASTVLDLLVNGTAPGLVRSGGGRYFGYVTGGTLPVAMAADWLTSTWDQNTIVHDGSPATAVAEEICAKWLVELLGLTPSTSVAFTPSTAYADLLALTVARHRVLADQGWDVADRGMTGAPPITVVVNETVHIAALRPLQALGLGGQTITLPTDNDGRVDTAALSATVRAAMPGPLIYCGNIGEINTGGIDPLRQVCDIVHEAGGWVHLDAAFGLWAAASPRLRHSLLDGVELADSIATDTHKWLNTPYDCGVAFVKDAEAHEDAFRAKASYLHLNPDQRHPCTLNIDISRRSRVFPLWAALRHLGRRGIADLIDRSCDRARELADLMVRVPGVHICNTVTLNQVLLWFEDPCGTDHDAHTARVAARFQQEGVGWAGTSTWKGRTVLRLSLVNWSTTAHDVAQAAASLVRAHRGDGS